MNTIPTHHPHERHHVIPIAIAGSAAAVLAALLAGPVQLPFGSNPPSVSAVHHVKHLTLLASGAPVGMCMSTTHPLPGDVPPPTCTPVVAHTGQAAQPTSPVPCFRQFRVWAADTARPLGCE